MIRAAPTPRDAKVASPTVWGLSPTELHDRYWNARGVQVVRMGDTHTAIKPLAEQYLLTPSDVLVVFRLRGLMDQLNWLRPQVMWLQVRNAMAPDYREYVQSDATGQLQQFSRTYRASHNQHTRAILTPDRRLAAMWQQLHCPRNAWRQLKQSTTRHTRTTAAIDARICFTADDEQVMSLMLHLIEQWKHPDQLVSRVRRRHNDVCHDEAAHVDRHARFVGRAWIGAGRRVTADRPVVGPAVLWDAPNATPNVHEVNWYELEPGKHHHRPVTPPAPARFSRWNKYIFDKVFALTALILCSPLFPLIILAIWLEDGRPFFFGHRREGQHGRTFRCLKFRSMCKNAEQIKAQISEQNQADGPQFHIENDPRITRVGRVLRKYHFDELPQFINVLLGQMSTVGPRPSPYWENQYCPEWREARLSTRPGITGLWQVMRTRRKDLDFQEWIRYDIEYVEHQSFRLDLWIIWRTVVHILTKGER